MDKLLSIVITTKNRKETLYYSVKSALTVDFNADEMELVVQDCSDNDESQDLILKSYPDPRIKYKRSPTGISMTDNFNYSIQNVTGKYICIIGDDDGILPSIKDIVLFAEKNNAELVSNYNFPRYYWPNFPDKRMAGRVFVEKEKEKEKGGKIYRFQSENCLVQSSFGISGPEAMLPRIYQGLISKRVLDEVKAKTGSYFSTYTPDFYMMYASMNFVKEHYKVDYSFTLSGSSANSNAGRLFAKRNAEVHTKDYEHYEWEDVLPDVRDVFTICAETRFKAFKDIGRPELNANLDLIKLYAVVCAWYPKEFSHHYRQLKSVLKRRNELNFKNISRFYYLILKRTVYGLFSKHGDGTSYLSMFKYLYFSPKLKADTISDACLIYQEKVNAASGKKFADAVLVNA